MLQHDPAAVVAVCIRNKLVQRRIVIDQPIVPPRPDLIRRYGLSVPQTIIDRRRNLLTDLERLSGLQRSVSSKENERIGDLNLSIRNGDSHDTNIVTHIESRPKRLCR